MGGTNPGRNMWVGLGIQTTMSTVAQVITFMQPTEVGGFLEEYATIENSRRLGTRFSGFPYIGTKQVPFNFTVEANPADLGRILLAAMGSEYSTPSVTSVVHNHTFRFANSLPYCTIFAYLAGVADTTATDQSLRIRGSKINQLTISGGIDNVITVAVEGFGMTASACSTVTTAFRVEEPWFLNASPGTGTLSIGSAILTAGLFEEAREFELTINNGLQADHRIHGSNTMIAVSEGGSEVTGRIVAVQNPSTMIEVANFAAGNNRAITLTAVAAKTTYSLPTTMAELAIGIDKARYTGDSPSYDPDVITIEMPFKAEISLVSTYISIKNNKSLPYSAAV
jgi:hypothetical protein